MADGSYKETNMTYTDEQRKDIEERSQKASDALKELNLTPAAVIQKTKLSEGIFADQISVYLADTKYQDEPTQTS